MKKIAGAALQLSEKTKAELALPPSHYAYNEWLVKLHSQDPSATKIRLWIQKNEPRSRHPSNPPDWERCVWMLARRIEDFRELTNWEVLSAKSKKRHVDSVIKHAKALAKLLGNEPRPYYPSALGLFGDESALDILRALPKIHAEALIRDTGYQLAHFTPKIASSGEFHRPPSAVLESFFAMRGAERLAPILERLVAHAEAIELTPRAPRPGTETANQVAFTLYLAEHFRTFFRLNPNEIIACCVALKYPEFSGNADTIRAWRGQK